jgi:CRISPR-associated endonuclease/helicase Cas3
MQHGFGLGGKQNADEGIGMTKQLASTPREGGASSWLSFQTFFHETTGKSPYGYQCRLACGPQAHPDKPDTLLASNDCSSRLINIPTGLGKTAAVVLAWLWNRAHLQNPQWPRRLVYCLPMRTLVEQTDAEVKKWLTAHKLLWDGSLSNRAGRVGVHILMGGEDVGEWDIYPEENAILIGTQDMLLSRALNRGYSMSRYRWPMHFGLLNNDCLWVMDETQLMGVGVETSAQLDGFRHDEKLLTFGVCPSWWMSATLDEARLATVDRPKPIGGWPTEKLSDTEQTSGQPHKLITAQKKLSPAPLALNSTTKSSYAKQLAALIKDAHQPGTLTLVVVNRVSRAREVFEMLTGGKKPLYAPERVALIHSRFRPIDRERHTGLLFGDGDRIVIATQAVEAGIDVSARLLITELSPWSSLVQRMGRCNRRADIGNAQVLWVDIQPKDDKDDLLRPYSETELKKARTAITPLTDASPQALREVTVAEEKVIRPVIRRRDLVDLFDTTPDICGQDLDISRYIRDGDDNDVQFFWRDIKGDAPLRDDKPPQRIELCRVSIGDALKFFDRKTTHAWRWNPLEKKWELAEKPRPGGVYLLAMTSGGYSNDLGWTGDPKDKPTPLPSNTGNSDAHDDEPDTFSASWQTIAEHTQLVVRQTTALAAALTDDATLATALRTAALWHDIGKAHDEFQKMLRNGDAAREGQLWAKSADKSGKCERHGFRHELGSALGWLLKGPADAVERDLVAYLIAAHHGKVRLSIRSLPDETGNPQKPNALFARGIWQDDVIHAVPLDEFTAPEISLDLSFMQMGEGQHGPSWLCRTVALRDRLGPFRLAFLETVLRAADARASRETTT